MNSAQLHLLFNHLPIMGTYLSIPLLIFALFRRRDTGAITAAMIMLLMAGAGAWIAVVTGEEAEIVIEVYPDISERIIENHEEKAELAAYIASAVSLLVLVGLIWITYKPIEKVPLILPIALIVIASISSVFFTRAGHSGGEIRHPELHLPGYEHSWEKTDISNFDSTAFQDESEDDE